jgi:hypothetical protein
MRTTRMVRWFGAMVLVLAVTSACISAFVDAATIAARADGRVIASRPLWLHTFSISALTALAVVVVLWRDAAVATGGGRVVLGLVALVNLTVPVLRRGRNFGVVFSMLHAVVAGLLLAMMLARSPTEE